MKKYMKTIALLLLSAFSLSLFTSCLDNGSNAFDEPIIEIKGNVNGGSESKEENKADTESGAKKEPIQTEKKSDPVPVPVLPEFQQSLGNFSFTLLRKTIEGSDENTILSPLSVMTALSMLELGLEEESLAEVERLFGLTREKQNEFLGEYLKTLSNDGLVKSANSLWFKNGFDIKQPFKDKNKEYFKANVFEKPFDESTKNEINKWISDNTDGMIKDMLEEISQYARFYLINTVLFNGKWEKNYREEELVERTFTTSSGQTKKTRVMYLHYDTYYEYNEAKIFKKDYEGERYTFVAILPKEGQTLSNYLAMFKYSEFSSALKKPIPGIVNSTLPLFEYEYKKDCIEILRSLGVETIFNPFDSRKNLSGISDVPELYVDLVLHAAKIELTSEGTKAAGATVVGGDECALPGEPVNIFLDRPFLYMIYDKEGGVPVFVGTATDIGE